MRIIFIPGQPWWIGMNAKCACGVRVQGRTVPA